MQILLRLKITKILFQLRLHRRSKASVRSCPGWSILSCGRWIVCCSYYCLFRCTFYVYFESRARCCIKHSWILKPNMLIFYRHLVRVECELFRSRWQKMSTSGRRYLHTHVIIVDLNKLIDRVWRWNCETAAEFVEHSTEIVFIFKPRFTSINHQYFKMMCFIKEAGFR